MTAHVHPMPSRRLPGSVTRPTRRPVHAVGPVPAPPAAARPTPGRRPTAAQFRRRRAVAAFTAAVLLGGGAAVGVLGDVPLTPSGRAPAAGSVSVGAAVPVAQGSYVVRPGDTLWAIARALQPTGDVRPVVQRLAAGRGGAPLRAGERLELPPG
ncbi:MAG TPA: LysM domain-containing protein [Acidimicrobiales bacterium]|nr:LysM domain-containing protein [Acidimicrobiales bacterium]